MRFYDARRTSGDTQGTALAIAVKSTGEPLYNGTTLKYRMYDRITSSATTLSLLTMADATTAVDYVKSAGETGYCIDFKKDDIQTLITSAGCNGIRLKPERLSSGDWSMRMHPANIPGSSGTVLPSPPSSVSAEPCPSLCGGTTSYYIHL